MDNIRGIISGTVITLLIGGTAYTFTQEDVVQNFANDTGMTQEQAEQYVSSIPEEELVSWKEVGSDFTEASKETFELVASTDCENYEYEWETPALTCTEGKSQLQRIANTEQALGQAYLKLSSDDATEEDMYNAMNLLDQLNADYRQEIGGAIFDKETLDEITKTNLYNKSILKAAVEST